MKANMQAVTVDEEYNPTIDYEKIVCAEGSLQDGTLAVALNEDQDMITITQEAQSRWSVGGEPDRRVVRGGLRENGKPNDRGALPESSGKWGDDD